MPFTALPTFLQPLQQQGFLQREFQQALQTKKAYRLGAMRVPVPTGVGTTFTQTKMGRKAPAITPLNAANRVGSQTNGITPSTGGAEQWTFTMNEYGDARPLNLMDQETTIKRLFLENAYLTGEEGSQALEWLCRNAIHNAYMQGDSYALGGASTTAVHLNDVRGFQNVMSNGVLVPVSTSNPLTVVESGTTPQVLSVTNCVVDGSNVSTAAAAGGISGIITFATATTPTVNDRFLSASASVIIRPNGKPTTVALTGGDTLKVQNVLDAAKVLNKNGVPRYPDGTYHCPIDFDGIVQLMADPRFQAAWMGAYNSKEIQEGQILKFGGITFISTTEAIIQAPVGGVLQTVHRAVVMGYNCIAQADFAGMAASISRLEGTAGHIEMAEDLAMVVKAPTDTLLENITQAWKWVGDFEATSDNTTNPSVMPTSNNALFKRGVEIEYVG